jgi:CubicO group peptidase (beta-lactamase class C family)
MREILLLTSVVAGCTPEVGVHRPVEVPQTTEEAWLRSIGEAEDWRVRMGATAMALGVVVDGRLAYTVGLGEVDGQPVGDDTVFRWASVSKPHVATVVHRLVDEGVLSLDAPMSAYLPGFRTAGNWSPDDPTLRQLLDHTAGLPDQLLWDCDEGEEPLTELFDGTWQPPLLAPSGAVHNYSNTHFTALGAVLESITGQPFAELMHDELFEPLGMRTATYRPEEAAALGAPDGLGGIDGAKTYPLTEWDCSVSRPPAWLHGSVRDLARFSEHVLSDASPDSLHEGMARAVDTRWWGDGGPRMGPGFYRTDYRGTHRMWHHDGWVTGFASHLAVLPDEGLAVMLVVNRDDANTGGLRNKVLDLFLGIDSDEPAHEPLYTSLALQQRWVGTYDQPLEGFAPEHAVGDIVVSVIDGVMAVTFPEREPVPLVQLDGDTYGYVIDEEVYEVRFVESFGERFVVHRYYVGTARR